MEPQKILVVDDDEDSLVVLQRSLEFAGYGVLTATNGRQALEVLAHQPVDGVVSDILMPEMDGFQLLRAIRGEERLASLPFIFYSATYNEEEDRRLAADLGADLFVDKPRLMAEFLDVLAEVLRNAQGRRRPAAPADAPGLDARYGKVVARKLAEKTRELALYRQIFQAVSEPIAILDPDGFFIDQNQAHRDLFGFDDSALAGHTLERILGPRFEGIRLALADQGAFRGVCRGRTRDGREIDLELSVFPVTNGNRKVRCLVAVGRDVTERRRFEAERRRLEEQLLHAQKMDALGTMAGGIAHEFNNILTTILGYLELVELRLDPASDLAPDLEQIKAAGLRAAGLVRQLLHFSRRLPGQRPTLAVDCNAVVARLVADFANLLGEDIRLEHRLARDLWPVTGDPERLAQVLLNLALNARDAMAEGGILRFTTRNRTLDEAWCRDHLEARPGDFVEITVRDSGTGIDETTRAKAFEPFFTTKPVGQGAGLGLPVAYGIVRDLEGWMELESEVGAGTTVRVFLPRSRQAAAAEPPAGATNLPRGRFERVLVVEDDADIRRLVVSYLEAQGYRPLAAASAEEALALLERRPMDLDLLFTDVVLPGRSGLFLAREIQRVQPGCKVLLTSGYTDLNRTRRQEIQQLGLPFLEKPYRLPALLPLFHRLLRQSG